MPITQQQFDLMAAVLGPERAAQEARDAGGVIPSQGQVAPTQITGAQPGTGLGGYLTAGRTSPGEAGAAIARADVPQNVFSDFVQQPAGLTDREKILAAEGQFKTAWAEVIPAYCPAPRAALNCLSAITIFSWSVTGNPAPGAVVPPPAGPPLA